METPKNSIAKLLFPELIISVSSDVNKNIIDFQINYQIIKPLAYAKLQRSINLPTQSIIMGVHEKLQ